MTKTRFVVWTLGGLLVIGLVMFSMHLREPEDPSGQTVASDSPDTSRIAKNDASQDETDSVEEQKSTPAAPKEEPAWTRAEPLRDFAADRRNPRPAMLRNSKLLDQRETATSDPTIVKRLKVMESEFKYPYLRVEETVKRDRLTGDEVVLDRLIMVADHLIVKVKPGTTEDDLEAVSRKYGATIRRKMHAPNMYLVQLGTHAIDAVPDGMERLAQDLATIAYAEPDYIVEAIQTLPNDASLSSLYAMNNTGQTGGTPDADIDAAEAWDITTGSKSIMLGVIDTGIDYTHPDLAANTWTNAGEVGIDGGGNDKRTNGIDDDGNGFIDDFRGWDFVNDDNDPMDDHNHGSHCSGTIGGVGNNSVGVVGVNWHVSIVGIKFLSSGGGGTISDGVEAIYYGTKLGARLTSNSWGGGGFSQAMLDAINDAHTNGVLFIAAAGNSNNNNDSNPHYPSSYTSENVIAVAATDHNDAKASFSSYGAASVDLGAPGVNILSTVAGGGYSSFNGTSMATPHVSGVAALLWSLNPGASHTTIRNAIFSGVDPVASMSGITMTGGRLNAYKSILEIGMSIVRSVPADGSVIFTNPTSFTIDFSDAYSNASVAASDLTVNGTAADGFVLTDSNTVTFTYATTPVVAEGTQTMNMVEDAITRIRDGEGNNAWSAGFRYDAVPLDVVSMSPADGAVVSIPFSSLTLNFNEAIDPASVGVNDLVINQGSVVTATVVDADTVAYTLAGISVEDTFTVQLPEGAITDVFGNPGLAYNASVILDVDTAPYPLPLEAKEPMGSLAYDPSVSASMASGTDVDAFTIALDADQAMTVVLTPGAGLQGVIEILDPSSTSLGSATSATAGDEAILQVVPVASAGTYTLRVSAAGGTSGPYALQLLLNAAVEHEAHGGPTNDTLAVAEDLNAYFSQLAGIGEMAVVLGDNNVDPEQVYVARFEEGLSGFTVDNTWGRGGGLWHLSTGRSADGLDQHSPTQNIYYGEAENETGNGDYDTGAANAGAILSPSIHLPSNGLLTLKFNYFLETEGSTSWDVPSLAIDDGSGFSTVLTSSDGTLPVGTGGQWDQASVDVSHLTGASIVLRFGFDTVDSVYNGYEGWYIDDIVIESSLTKDYYSFQLDDGELTTIAVSAYDEGSLSLVLLDPSGVVVATGSDADGFSKLIRDYTATSSGTHVVCIEGGGVRYGLVVTRNAAFDTEPNSELATAQSLGEHGVAVGSVADGSEALGVEVEPNDNGVVGATPADLVLANDLSSSFVEAAPDQFEAEITGDVSSGSDLDWDFFKFFAGPGDSIEIFLKGSASSSGTLSDPYLWLFDQSAAYLTANDDSFGTLESHIIYSNFAYAGDYYIVADSFGGNAGTYTLTATLTSTNPAIGQNSDFYSMTFVVGDEILIETHTPGGGPYEFENDLDPTISLFDPSGTLVVSNDNGAIDAKNARISYVAPTSGAYRIRVSSATGGGEYILGVNARPISISLPSDAEEDAGVLVGAGRVAIQESFASNIVVSLLSMDTSEILVPSNITILAGQTSATFNVTVIDDNLLDGTRVVDVNASAPGFAPGRDTIRVHDTEIAALTLFAAALGTEGDGVLPTPGLVYTDQPVSNDVTVYLHAHDTSELTVPAAVIIPAGATGTVFTMTVVDDHEIDGPQLAPISATVSNWSPGYDEILVLDNEHTNLILSLPAKAWEADGEMPSGGRVSIAGTLQSKLTITLASDDTSEVMVPSTVEIVAGQTTVTFSVSVQNDTSNDGLQTPHVAASAPAFISSERGMIIYDDDPNHFAWSSIASPQQRGASFNASIVAKAVDNVTISNYAGAAILSGSGDGGAVTIGPSASAPFAGGVWSGSLHVDTLDENIVLTAGALSASTGLVLGMSNPFDVVGPICNVSPGSLTGTVVAVDQTTNRVLTVSNTGTAPLILQASTLGPSPAVFTNKTLVQSDLTGARMVKPGDVDGDGDVDMVACAYSQNKVAWYENMTGLGNSWSQHVISTTFNAAWAVDVADVDGDGDLDVMSAGLYGDQVAWWVNDAGDGSAWTYRLVDGDVDEARSVHAADVDGDGDIDLLATSVIDDDVSWWENTSSNGTTWTKHIVDGAFDGATAVYSGDIDGDGHRDIVATCWGADDVAWWENNGASTAWTKHTIDSYFDGAVAVHVSDVDGDGDQDVLAAAITADDIAWWENVDGSGTSWTKHTIDAAYYGAYSISTADVDKDGDQDIVSAAIDEDDVTWWENTDGSATALTEHIVDGSFNGAISVDAGDLDGDGAPDLIAAAYYGYQLASWENGLQVGWLSILPDDVVVEPGGSTNILVTFDATGFSPGDHVEGTIVISGNDALAPSKDIPVSMEVVGPDMVVASVEVPPSVKLGETFELTYVVENDEYGVADMALTLFCLSTDAVASVDDFLFENLDITPSLPAGQPSTNTVTLTMPTLDEWGQGGAYILVKVDENNEVDESDEENNVGASSLVAVTLPDLLGLEVYPLGYPPHPEVPLGFDVQFVAIAHYEFGYTNNVTASTTWTSMHEAVVHMTPAAPGYAETVGEGWTVIMSYYGGLSAVQSMNILPPVVTNFAVLPKALDALHVGSVQAFEAVDQYSDGAQDVFMPDAWVSSDPGVGIITANGFMLAAEAGQTDVYAIDGARTSQMTHVEVRAHVAGEVTGNGADLVGATIHYNGPQSGIATSGAGGTYQTPWLPAGAYNVWASHPDFLSDSTSTVTLGPNRTDMDFDLVSPRIVVSPDSQTNMLVLAGCATSSHVVVQNTGLSELMVNEGAIVESVSLATNARIAIFYHSAFVDTGTSAGSEAYTTRMSLQSMGHAVTTIVGTAASYFESALEGANILVIPEQENGNLGPALSPAARMVISNFVASGGGLIVFGSNYDDDFVSAVLGISPVGAGTIGTAASIQPGAAGTAFEGGPATLSSWSATFKWDKATLPAGIVEIYGVDSAVDYTTAALFPHGQGKVAYLGWDWFNAAPVGARDGGWLDVLSRAVEEVRGESSEQLRFAAICTNEAYGDWDMIWAGTLRDRGNVFKPEQAVLLKNIEAYLGLASSMTLKFFVYESETQSGVYTKIHESTRTGVGPGEGWYVSEEASVLLDPCKYYYIGAAWDGNASYGRGNGSPTATRFGTLESGVPSTAAGYPPSANVTLNVPSGFIDAYRQRLTFAYAPAADAIWYWPHAFVLGAGESIELTTVFDASGLIAGERAATNMILLANDPTSPTNIVPLAFMTLPPAPAMLDEPAYTVGASNTVAWTPVPGADDYWAEYAVVTTGAAVADSHWISSDAYTFTGLSDSVTYYYRAKASVTTPSGAYVSDWSDWVSSLQLSAHGDKDGDGIVNGWEALYGLNALLAADALWDEDGDGVINLNEYLSSTMPRDGDSVLRLLEVHFEGDMATIMWKGGTDVGQEILYASNLVDSAWTCIYTNGTPTPVTNVIQHEISGGVGYFIIKTRR